MIRHPHVDRFRALRANDSVPDPHNYTDPRDQVLWVLAVVKDDPDLAYLTPAEIADILCDAEGIRVSRQQVAAILGKERKTVARRRSAQRDRFTIMKVGADALMA